MCIVQIDEAGKVWTIDDLNDLFLEFQLYHGAELSKMQAWEKAKAAGEDAAVDFESAAFRKASRKDQYQLCVQAELSESFSINILCWQFLYSERFKGFLL